VYDMYTMFSPVIQEFAVCLPADSGLLRASVIAGEPIDQTEVLSLAAIAQSLFVSITLESRTLNRVEDCLGLWADAARLFSELCNSWDSVPESGEPSITWLRGRLEHYRSLCEDRCELYSISEQERLLHAKCKEAEMSDNGSSSSESEPVRDFSKLEVAKIESAYHRLGA
jgi:hypothetical protein